MLSTRLVDRIDAADRLFDRDGMSPLRGTTWIDNDRNNIATIMGITGQLVERARTLLEVVTRTAGGDVITEAEGNVSAQLRAILREADGLPPTLT